MANRRFWRRAALPVVGVAAVLLCNCVSGGVGTRPRGPRTTNSTSPISSVTGHRAGQKAVRLETAIGRGDVDAVRSALDSGTPATQRDEAGTPLLCVAAKYSHQATITLLLSRGAKVNDHDAHRSTALHHAAASCETGRELISVLVRAGAELEARDVDGCTPLLLAARFEAPEAAAALLAAGAKVDAADNEGRTGLHWAADKGLLRTAKLLLEHGASRTAKDKAGRTPLTHAKRSGRERMVELLAEPATGDGQDAK